MIKVLSIFGTRPEAIKMAPVIKTLQAKKNIFNSRVCVTAQHRQMLDQVLELFEITPDFDLNSMKAGQDLFDITCNVLSGLKDILKRENPDVVLVHGDTTTTMTASLAAFYLGIPVGHVEAGLRTHNKLSPFPEEVNRRVTSIVANYHFPPTESSRNNLLAERVDPERIHVTGNTVIDALFMTIAKTDQKGIRESLLASLINQFPSLEKPLTHAERRILLVTGHRRENFGDGFDNICQALRDISVRYPHDDIIYPVHLNPNVQAPVHRILGKDRDNIHLIAPLDYLPFVFLMNESYMVITDSGGIQEEAPSLGKPVLLMRDTTERPEALNADTVTLVGTNREKIFNETCRLLDDDALYEKMSIAHNPYGDGKAAERIANFLAEKMS